MASAHCCILRCLTQLRFEASKSHACVERSIKAQEISFSWRKKKKKKKLDWAREWWSEVREITDGQGRRAGVLLFLLFWRWICFFAIESDDHLHLWTLSSAAGNYRATQYKLRSPHLEGMSWRWPLHKFESCSWAWIHVDTLKITANGQEKNSSASKSQWGRTFRYPFCRKVPRKKQKAPQCKVFPVAENVTPW